MHQQRAAAENTPFFACSYETQRLAKTLVTRQVSAVFLPAIEVAR